MTEPELSIVLCCFNEAERIGAALDDVLASMAGRPETVEILVIDNGSTDGTREFLATVDHPAIEVILNERNLGKGGSVKKGLRRARGRHVVIHDPDLEYLAKDIWPLLDLARREEAALVLGSRFLGQGQSAGQTRANYLGVLGLTGMIRLLYGCRITDSATAMKLLRGDLARRLHLECDGFELDFEIVVRIARLGGKILEGPIEYHPRSRAEGKKVHALRDGLRALRPILGDRLRSRQRFLNGTH